MRFFILIKTQKKMYLQKCILYSKQFNKKKSCNHKYLMLILSHKIFDFEIQKSEMYHSKVNDPFLIKVPV